jgi:type IV secretory pathway VirB4 component
MIGYRTYLPEFFDSLETYQRSIFNIEEIKELLEPYTEGELSYLLNADKDINIVDDTLIAYDMEDVKGKDHFPIVAILTLTVIIDKIKKRRGIPKTLIIDEALDFLVDEKFGDLIGMLFRQFRKKEGEITIAAQNVQFIMNAAPLVRESILANADTKIILEHGEKYKKQVTDLSVLNFTQEEQEQILGLQRSNEWREFGIKLGNEFFIFRNGVSQECAVAFDSRQSTVVEIENLYKEKGSIPAAIYAFIENQKKIMT